MAELLSASAPLEPVCASLLQALEALPDAVAVFDADDRLVFFNTGYTELYSRKSDLVLGTTFEALIRTSVAEGLVAEASGGEEAWIAERLRQHGLPSSAREHRLANGRWMRTVERRTADGWSIGIRSDITEPKTREESFRLLFEASPTPMYVVDRQTLTFAAVNDAALTLYGYDRDRFLSMTLLDIRPQRHHAEFLRLVEDGSMFDYPGIRSWTHVRADGCELSVLPHTKPLEGNGRPLCLVSIVDLTERQRAEDEVRRAKAFLRSVVESMPVGVFVKDMNDRGRYLIYNRAGEVLVGRSRSTLIGKTDDEIFTAEEAARFQAQDASVIRDGKLLVMPEEAITRGDGALRTILTKKLPIAQVGGDEAGYVLGIVEDITERREMERRLDRMAHHDPLTGLPNRTLLHRRLDALATRGCRGAALFYVDLDGFKAVNDTLGHRIGDGLLCAVASRLSGLSGPLDVAARIGGDEFIVVQDQVANPDHAMQFAERLVEVLSRPYDIDGRHVVIGASLGFTLAASAGDDPESMMRKADTALYAVKTQGGRSCLMYRPEMDTEKRRRRELAIDLKRALEAGEFVLHYQPLIEIESGAVTGYEALVRWQHPVHGLTPPSVFIPVAEELGLIGTLGDWVVRQACLDAARWEEGTTVAVNLSPLQFKDPDLVAGVSSALRDSGLDARRLELEITETVLLDGNERNRATLYALRRLGLTIALDDFGTGYSSLSLVQRFAVDRIKIDRSFTRGLPLDRGCLAVVRAVVALAKSLDIETTAEGVETQAQLDCIRAEGCGAAQGYLFGHPGPAGAARPLQRTCAA